MSIPEFTPVEYTPPKKPWFKRPVFYVLIMLAMIIGYYGYQFGSAYTTISIENGSWFKGIADVFNLDSTPKPTIDPNPMPKPEKDRLDILILGVRGDDPASIEAEGGLLTDTMMLVSIDRITKKAAMVSIPRDLFLNMNAQAPNSKDIKLNGKINEVYERGLENGSGITLAKQIISRITGVYVDNAIVFDFNAFKDIVNTLGGIDIHLSKSFNEAKQWGYDFSLPVGNNHLDGEQALYYARSRYSSNDFDRARRQQEVIAAIKNKAANLGFLSNPSKVTSFLSDIKGDIRTDFQIWDINDMLALGNALSSKTSLKNYVISIDNLVSESKTAKGEYILLPKSGDFSGIKNFFRALF